MRMMGESSAQEDSCFTGSDPIVLNPVEMQYEEPVHGGAMATAVLERFRNDENLMALPVVDDRLHPLGLVTRRKILSVFGHKYSHELYRRKQVDILMECQAIVLDHHTGIELISQAMTDREMYCAFDPAIMTREGAYCGMLSVISILRSITGSRIEQAYDSNPLTRLPGNNSINSQIDRRLQAGERFVLAYIDLDYFKVFNDHYGYERGDRVIQLVATILRETTANSDFIGHIGGDDFVMVLCDDDWEARIWSVLNAFSIQSRLLYNHSERDKGFIEAADRLGHIRQFPMASLSVSAVTCPPGRFDSHLVASEVIAEIKHRSKKIEGNSLVVDRRDTA